MKKAILLLLLIPCLLFGQSIPVPPNSFGTITDMRMQGGTSEVQVLLNGLVSVGDGNGGTYAWKPLSVAADDGFITLKVANITTGRWVRIGNSNTLKGTTTLSGTTLTTTYFVSFNQTLPFIPITVLYTPRTQAAGQPSWITTITTTGFTIVYQTVPILGTNNMQLDWVAIKQ